VLGEDAVIGTVPVNLYFFNSFLHHNIYIYLCCVVLCCGVLYNVMQYFVVLCCMDDILHKTVLYCIIVHDIVLYICSYLLLFSSSLSLYTLLSYL
jgi:hypothetical protein